MASQTAENADREKFSRADGGSEDPNEDEKSRAFEEWLLANGAKFPSLTLRKYDDEVRGVHASREIGPDEDIVEVPLRCLITVEMGKATDIGRAVLTADIDFDAPKHVYLMLFMLIDRKREDSFFKPYYDILPATLSNMPIFWNSEELSYLRGSYLLAQIEERNLAIAKDYDAICELCPQFADIATLDDFKWARMCVCSRNFGISVDGVRTSAMVPYADMLNHYRPRETKWAFDQRLRAFTITTLQSIECGAQVYDSYGQKCNHRFLLNYGFSIENNREEDGFCPNEVPFMFELDQSDPLFAIKQRLWIMDGHQTKMIRVCVSDNENTSLAFACLRVIVATAEEFRALTTGANYTRNSIPAVVKEVRYPISLANEKAALQKLNIVIDQMLSEYPTSLEQDQQRLASDELRPFSNERHAVIQVMGEKEVLHHFKHHCRIAIGMLQMDVFDDEAYVAALMEHKRQGVSDWILRYCSLDRGAIGTCRRLERRARQDDEQVAATDPTKPHTV